MNQVDKEVCIDQADYITILKHIDISKERKRDRSSKLDQSSKLGQLGWNWSNKVRSCF